MEKKETLTYRKAVSELESILASLEKADPDVDEMVKQVKRATELIQFCRERLTKTDDALRKIYDEQPNIQ